MSDTPDLASVLAAAERAAAGGDFSTAEALLREAARRQEAELGPQHPELAHTLNNLGVICERVGKPADAGRCYRRARDIAAAALPADHPFVLTSERNLREFCAARGLPVEPPGQPAAAALESSSAGLPASATRPVPAAAPAGRTNGSSASAASAHPGPAPAPPRAGVRSSAAVPGGSGGEPHSARRARTQRVFRRGPAMTAAGAAALVFLILLATRTCRNAHQPADSARVPGVAGQPGWPAEAAGSASGAGTTAPGDPAGETHAVGSPPASATSGPGERLRVAGAGSARSARGQSDRGDGARAAGPGGVASSEPGASPERPGATRPDVGAGGARAGRTSSPTPPQPHVSGETAPPRAPRAPRRGPSPPGRPVVTEARLCASLSAATWRCRPATSPVGTGPLVFYTRVRAQQATTVHHRWYAGTRLRQAVALRIGPGAGDGFRTFSRTRVFPVAGGWRVELRAQDGTLLHEARFEVR